MIVHRWLNLNTFCYDSKFNLNADLSNRFHARTWPIETNHEIPGLIFLMIIRHKKMNKTTTVKTCCYILILHLWSQQTGLGPPMLSSPSEGIEHTFHEKCWIIGKKWHFYSVCFLSAAKKVCVRDKLQQYARKTAIDGNLRYRSTTLYENPHVWK